MLRQHATDKGDFSTLLRNALDDDVTMPPGFVTPGSTAAETPQARVFTGYSTKMGRLICGRAEDLAREPLASELRGRVNLVFTSPPFPLRRKKSYGNEDGQAYVSWIRGLAPVLADLLAPDGSVVMEIGNAWNPGEPTMSTLPLEALMAFREAGKFHVCQQFVCNNPARLPGPAEWVNVRRVRVKDSFTHVWWFAKTPWPKADNRQVLTDYKPAMQRLLKTGKYNAGKRPSGHLVGETSFLTEHAGAIPSNMLSYANTRVTRPYTEFCEALGVHAHPARMQSELAGFFINMLTTPADLVLDPFGGSNTTGSVAEELGRRWVAVEAAAEFALGSMWHFQDQLTKEIAEWRVDVEADDGGDTGSTDLECEDPGRH